MIDDSSRNIAVMTARHLFDNDDGFLVLDTETTGLDDDARILEISIIDSDGAVLLDALVKPIGVSSWDEAQAIHGISIDDVEKAPTIFEFEQHLHSILVEKKRPIVIFNSSYDIRLLRQSFMNNGFYSEWIDDLECRCAMDLSSDYFGPTNQYGTISLANAAKKSGVRFQGKAHRALADCLATLDVLKYISVDETSNII